MDGFPSDGFVTTTLLARSMPFGAPSTPSFPGGLANWLESTQSHHQRLRSRHSASVAPLSREAGADATMDIGSWLRGLGLEQYEAAFRDNEIDGEVLPK